MASITVSLPDDLASQIRAQEQQLPRILELGLRELNASGQSGFDGAADVLELLAALPTAEEILKLRPLYAPVCPGGGTDREKPGR
jgi:hypothetical protein